MLTIGVIEKQLKNNEKINWLYISRYDKLWEDFIRKFADKVDWTYISEYQILSESFVREFKDKVDWDCISAYQILSESFVREFADKVNWINISIYQILSESFIREFQDKVNWSMISECQILSEDFIREFKDKVFWINISKYQILLEGFIREFADKVDWGYISIYQKLSEKFIEEFNLSIPKVNMLYWTEEEKIKRIKDFGFEYNDKEQYIYAYKSVRENLSSVFNPIVKYKLKEKINNRICNCTISEEYSAGLSAGDRKNALDYYNEGKLLKVMIDLKDLGCITNKGKIRAFALTPIEIVE